MIFLSLDTDRQIDFYRNASEEEKREAVEVLPDLNSGLAIVTSIYTTFNSKTTAAVEGSNVKDEDGRQYDHIKFKVNTVFTISGVKYFSDGTFALPLIDILKTHAKIIEDILL